jgi:hypothetical protein
VAGRSDYIQLFPESERARVEEHERRNRLLCEDPREIAEQFIADYVPAERTDTWGPPDTSSLAIVSLCRQLTTPGHYGVRPRVFGPDADEVVRLLTDAGAWEMMQEAQYLACGHVMVWRFVRWSSSLGRAVVEIIPPHLTRAVSHPDDPRVPVEWWRLQERTVSSADGKQRRMYTWDVWSIADPERPFYAVHVAGQNGVLGEDVSTQALLDEDGNPLTRLEGPDYPCVDPTGRPFLPVVAMRYRDTGSMFSESFGRGAFVGTLHGVKLRTYAGKAAVDATGDSFIACDMEFPSATVSAGEDGQRVRTLNIEPGTIIPARSTTPGTQPSVHAVSNGGHLAVLQAYVSEYIHDLQVDYGVPMPEQQRAANPASGSAIRLTNAVKRAEQRRQDPLVRRADLDMIARIVWLARRAGATTASGAGIGIEYEPIPLGPEEEQAEREQTDWDLERGIVSPIDVYQRRNVGASRDDALRELARVQADVREIQIAAGIAPRVERLVGTMDGIRQVALDMSSGGMTPELGRWTLVRGYGLTGDEADEAMELARKIPPRPPENP